MERGFKRGQKWNAKSWLFGKDPDAGKDWRQEEKGKTEYKMVGWHHCLNGHEFEQALGDSEGQERLACCSPWGHKESDMTKDWTTTTKNGLKEASKEIKIAPQEDGSLEEIILCPDE